MSLSKTGGPTGMLHSMTTSVGGRGIACEDFKKLDIYKAIQD